MKKLCLAPVICLMLLSFASAPASAAESEVSGFYDVGSAENAEIVPVTASGEAAEAVEQNVDGREGNEVFYPGSAALRITITGTAPGKFYLLTVTGSEGILYADQQTAGAEASFLAAFPLPEEPSELTVSIGSDDEDFSKTDITLYYTPRAEESEPGPPEEPDPYDPAPDGGTGQTTHSEPSGPGEGTGQTTPSEPSDPDGGTGQTPPSDPSDRDEGSGQTGPSDSSEQVPDEGSEQTAPPETGLKEGYSDCRKSDDCPLKAYSDLNTEFWYHDGVHWALENGIMNGVDGERFDPDTAASRAMVVTVLWRMEGKPGSDNGPSFRDVPEGAWYTEAVRWAASEHIVEGYGDGLFGPDDSVSREQLATILQRFDRYKGTGTLPAQQVNLGIFLDAEHISAWAYDAMQWAVDMGLITGVGSEKLSPKTEAVRAQAATILMRYCALTKISE